MAPARKHWARTVAALQSYCSRQISQPALLPHYCSLLVRGDGERVHNPNLSPCLLNPHLTIRRTAWVCDICSILQKRDLHEHKRVVQLMMNVLFELFLPHPSLSTTSSSHTTRLGLFFFGPPRSLSTPPLWSPEPPPSPEPSSSPGCESWMVMVREPSPGADVPGRLRVDVE